MNGWIKLYRKIIDNPIVTKDADHLAIWIYLLLNATHDDYPVLFKGERVVLKAGQLVTGCVSIATRLSINETKVRRVLKAFESDGQIDRQTSNKNSLISILNWEFYQGSDGQNDEPLTDNRRTSDEQVADKWRTSDDKQEHKNIRTEEHKNRRTEKDNKAPRVYFPDDESLNQAFLDFADMRKKIKKPLTERAAEMQVNKLHKLANLPFSEELDRDLAIGILNQSTMNSWQSLYPLKEEQRGSNTGIDWSKV